MATKASAGKSTLYGAHEAGREAAPRAVASMEGSAPDFRLVCGTSGYDQGELLRGVRDIVGAAKLSGCSGEGVIAGRELARRVRERQPGLRVVFMSGCSEDLVAAQRADGVRDPFLPKPFTPGGLLDCVARVLQPQATEGEPELGRP